MKKIDLEKFEQLKYAGELPSPKGAALAIVRYTQSDGVSLSDLAHVVKTDPAFVGRLIKAANSVRAGGRRPIVSIHDALIVLGVPAVRSLALGFSLVSDYSKGSCRNFDYSGFWSRSLLHAVALQALTKSSGASLGEELFSVGLLAHIGELALATLFSDEYSHVLGALADDPGLSLLDLEQQTFVMNHADLSAAMLLDWGLPRVYVDVVAQLAEPDQADFVDGSRQAVLLDSLRVAEQIAELCLTDETQRGAAMPTLFLLGKRLAIDPDRLNAICDRVAEEWVEWGALLDVQATPIPPFAELSKMGVQPDVERLRVLLVGRAEGALKRLRAMLVEGGHEIIESHDSQQGFETALELRPQIMIIDWRAAGEGSVVLTKSLRQTKVGRGIYMLAVADIRDQDLLVEALGSGVDGLLSDALSPAVTIARIKAAQRIVRLQEEIERDREDISRFAAELAVTNRRLEELALTDILTGFHNRRYAMERMEQEWATAERGKRPLACMVIDIDEFKQINDNYGHDVGDMMLKEIATALKTGLRLQDVVCRTGGDEFLVICPATSLAAALVCAERTRHAVESVRIMAGMRELRSSISIGVAVRDVGMRDSDALIKRADQAAYAAKQGGRNRVVSLQSKS